MVDSTVVDSTVVSSTGGSVVVSGDVVTSASSFSVMVMVNLAPVFDAKSNSLMSS